MLVTDFFDAPSKAEAEKVESTSSASSKPATMADVLPEGFFDDPKMDAKVVCLLSSLLSVGMTLAWLSQMFE